MHIYIYITLSLSRSLNIIPIDCYWVGAGPRARVQWFRVYGVGFACLGFGSLGLNLINPKPL